MKPIDIIFRFLPLTTGFLILAGILYAIAFYSVFSLSILEYLEFSEIIILFLNNILYAAFIIALGFFLALPTMRGEKSAPKKVPFRKALFIIIGLGVCIVIYIFIGWQTLLVIIGLTLLLLGLCSLCINITVQIKKTYIAIYGEPFRRLYFMFFLMSLFYLTSILLIGFGNGLITRMNPQQWGTSCIIQLKTDSSFSTNDTIMYLGRSHNYTFFYNLKSTEKTVLSNDEIRSIKLK